MLAQLQACKLHDSCTSMLGPTGMDCRVVAEQEFVHALSACGAVTARYQLHSVAAYTVAAYIQLVRAAALVQRKPICRPCCLECLPYVPRQGAAAVPVILIFSSSFEMGSFR